MSSWRVAASVLALVAVGLLIGALVASDVVLLLSGVAFGLSAGQFALADRRVQRRKP